MRLTDFEALSFDCYGTLIDWETGIWHALEPWLVKSGLRLSQDEALAAFGRHETVQQSETPTALYPEVLVGVHRRIAAELGIKSSDEDAAAFGASVKAWPAFPDSAEALAYLKRHYKLFILSNIDRESFAASNEKLGVDFDGIFTAEEIGSYKPDRRNFAFLLEQLAKAGIEKSADLHTAESLYHDHVPGKDVGLATCWIHRRSGKTGHGATARPELDVTPDFRFESMAEMVEAHKRESA